MRKLILIFIFSVSIATTANAAPLKFHGLDWSMTLDEMLTQLKGEGYVCWIASDFEHFCQKDDAKTIIKITDAWVEFFCGAYNGCSYSYDQLAKAITSKYKIEPQYLRNEYDPELFYWEWNGEEGDRINLSRFHQNRTPSVMLLRGIYGKQLDF